jgi:hypothetical protein
MHATEQHPSIFLRTHRFTLMTCPSESPKRAPLRGLSISSFTAPTASSADAAVEDAAAAAPAADADADATAANAPDIDVVGIDTLTGAGKAAGAVAAALAAAIVATGASLAAVDTDAATAAGGAGGEAANDAAITGDVISDTFASDVISATGVAFVAGDARIVGGGLGDATTSTPATATKSVL